MTIKRVLTAIALASLMGIVLPMATAQAPPCFTFDGQIKTMQCPVSFRPTPVQYYSDSDAQSGLYQYQQATDEGNDDNLPSGFFDQQTINTLRENAARNQNQSQNASQQQRQEQQQQQEQQANEILAQLVQQQEEPQPEAAATNATTTNQTAPPASNLTSSDIQGVRASLNTTRQALENNDTQAVIESINRADGALFAIMLEEGPGPINEELGALSDEIQRTRESVRNLDNAQALEGLNAADSQLLLITEMLPTTTATENPQPQPQPEISDFVQEQQLQSPANETLPSLPEPEPQPVPPVQPEPEPVQQEEPTIRIPLNQTQQEIISIEEVDDLNINKTIHEITTITIVEGNRTTHREITTTEVPLK